MRSKNFLVIFAVLVLTTGAAIFLASRPAKTVAAATQTVPTYDKDGNLLPLTNYREWIYLTTGMDMSYTAKANGMKDESIFDNVFVTPEAWRSFQDTGTWPDKTIMVLEVREAKSRGSINLSGHYQGTDVMGFEVHVKDETRFAGKWAFFDFESPSTSGKLFPQSASCYSCHAAHGAVDTTFVQFYPTLLPIAEKKGTLSDAFVKENTDTSAIK